MNDRSDEHDSWLDGQLREVPIPSGLRQRLSSISLPSDDEIDAAIATVSIPIGLLSRLKSIPSRWQKSPWQASSPAMRFVRLAIAASVTFLLATAWLASVNSSASLAYRTVGVVEPEAITAGWNLLPVQESSDALTAPGLSILGSSPDGSRSTSPKPSDTANDSPLDVALPIALKPKRTQSTQPPMPNPRLATSALLVDPIVQTVLTVARSEVEFSSRQVATGRWPAGHGADLQLAKAEERFFLNRVGVFPPVQASDRPGMTLGLNFGDGSYDSARRSVRQGVLPPASQVRTEEFLAALAGLSAPGIPRPPVDPQNPDKPPAIPAFAMNVTGGPSPFSGAEYRLLHVGLRMRDVPRGAHRPTALTIALDTSAEMAISGRLEMSRRALKALASQLAAGDRLSLVTFDERAELVVDGAGVRESAAWQSAVASLQPRAANGAAPNNPRAIDPVAGIALALSHARAAMVAGSALPKQVQRRVVVVTHAGDTWSEETWDQLKRLVEVARGEGIRLDVLPVRCVEPMDSNWQRLAQAGGGALSRTAHLAQFQGLLLETLTGRSQVVLPDARLSVTFPGKNIVSYRLLGHEPSPAAGVQAAQIDGHLYGGQTVSVALEIRPTAAALAQAGDVELATVSLEWLDRRTGETIRSSRKLMRSQIKPTFAESPGAWQGATLVAGAAEVLRGSPFAEQITLVDIARFARQIPPPLADRAEFREFAEWIEQADALQRRSPPRTVKPRKD